MIELVQGEPERLTVLIDGVAVVGAGQNNDRFWMPRFREQSYKTDGPYGKQKANLTTRPPETLPTRRAVAPVFVGYRVEDGARKPQSVEVRMVQSTYQNGRYVKTNERVAQRYPVEPYSVFDTRAAFAAVPYPAWITPPPTLRFFDFNHKRRWEARRALSEGNRFFKIVGNIALASLLDGATSALLGRGGIDNLSSWMPTVFATAASTFTDSSGPKMMWQLLFLAISPAGQSAYQVMKEMFFNERFDDKYPAPPHKEVDLTVLDAIGALRKMIETRRGGSMNKDRSLGLTPTDLRKSGDATTAVFYDWLLYGEEQISRPGRLPRFTGLADGPAKVVKRSLDEVRQMGRETPGAKPLAEFAALGALGGGLVGGPQGALAGAAVVGGAKALLGGKKQTLSGTQLDARMLDPYFLAETRCEFHIEIHVMDHLGRIEVLRFDTLRANGIDAGMLMAGYAESRVTLSKLTEQLVQTIEDGSKDVIPWWVEEAAEYRLYGRQSATGKWTYDGDAHGWLGNTRAERLQREQQWETASKPAREKMLAAQNQKELVVPLIVNTGAMLNRLRDYIIGQPETVEEMEARSTLAAPNRVAYKDKDGQRQDAPPQRVVTEGEQQQRVEAGEEDDANEEGNSLSVALSVPDTAGLTMEDYNRFISKSKILFCHTYGIDDPSRIEDTNRAFVRFRDLYCPLIPERYDHRMGSFVVPKPTADLEKSPLIATSIVRRLPQIMIFSAKQASFFARTALKVSDVQNDVKSMNRDAKSSVANARRCFANVAQDYDNLAWTVEVPTRPLQACHPFEIVLNPMPGLQFAKVVEVKPNWQQYINVGALVGQVLPSTVSDAVYDYERTPDSVVYDSIITGGDNRQRRGDAQLLLQHRLPISSVAWSALLAMANGLVYAALMRRAVLHLEDTVQSTLDLARKAAELAADVIDIAYGINLKTRTLLPDSDLFWQCVPNAGLVYAMLYSLASWARTQRLLHNVRMNERLQLWSKHEFDQRWPRSLRDQATLFSKALRALSRNTRKLDLHLWPFTQVQCMVVEQALLPVPRRVSTAPYKEGKEAQVAAAAAAFQRVKRMIVRSRENLAAPITGAELRCFSDVVASRPILLLVEETDDATGVSMRILDTASLLGKQRGWITPTPNVNVAVLRSRLFAMTPGLIRLMGGLTLKDVNSQSGDRTVEKIADSLLNSTNAADNVDRVLVPPSGFAGIGTRDLGATSVLEDTVIWLDALDAATRLELFELPSPRSSSEVTDWTLESDERVHPYVIRMRPPDHCTIQGLAAIIQMPDDMKLPSTTPYTLAAVGIKDVISNPSLINRHARILIRRRKMMMWLVDRFIQLQMFAAASGEPGHRLQRVTVKPPQETHGYAFIAAAMAVAMAACATKLQWGGTLRLVVPLGLVDTVREKLEPLERLCRPRSTERPEDPMRAVPLCELCHVLVAVLK